MKLPALRPLPRLRLRLPAKRPSLPEVFFAAMVALCVAIAVVGLVRITAAERAAATANGEAAAARRNAAAASAQAVAAQNGSASAGAGQLQAEASLRAVLGTTVSAGPSTVPLTLRAAVGRGLELKCYDSTACGNSQTVTLSLTQCSGGDGVCVSPPTAYAASARSLSLSSYGTWTGSDSVPSTASISCGSATPAPTPRSVTWTVNAQVLTAQYLIDKATWVPRSVSAAFGISGACSGTVLWNATVALA
jgi:hypothetical protein